MVPTQLRVIYGDTDQMGVVYYANYLRFFEAGRNEYLRAKGLRYRDVEAAHGIHLPVVDAQVSYKSPARYDDLLVVETTLTRVGAASVRFEYRVLRESLVLAAGHTVHACVDPAGQLRRLPTDLRARLAEGMAADSSVQGP
jgi:acyl-CoA thioester hydrolase